MLIDRFRYRQSGVGALLFWLLLVAAPLSIAGCGAGQATDDGRLHIVATTGQIGDAVARMAASMCRLMR